MKKREKKAVAAAVSNVAQGFQAGIHAGQLHMAAKAIDVLGRALELFGSGLTRYGAVLIAELNEEMGEIVNRATQPSPGDELPKGCSGNCATCSTHPEVVTAP